MCGVLFVLLATISLSYTEVQNCNFPHPKYYVNYFTSDAPVIDGHLNDFAWEEVSWTDDFIDIQGPDYPTPRFLTKAKMRWDNNWLYVGAYLEETEVWAYQTEHDSVSTNNGQWYYYIKSSWTTISKYLLILMALRTTTRNLR